MIYTSVTVTDPDPLIPVPKIYSIENYNCRKITGNSAGITLIFTDTAMFYPWHMVRCVCADITIPRPDLVQPETTVVKPGNAPMGNAPMGTIVFAEEDDNFNGIGDM